MRSTAGAEYLIRDTCAPPRRPAVVTPAIAVIMLLVGVAAAYAPARRSLRIQPTEAPRAE
jgi:hypothetical protein